MYRGIRQQCLDISDAGLLSRVCIKPFQCSHSGKPIGPHATAILSSGMGAQTAARASEAHVDSTAHTSSAAGHAVIDSSLVRAGPEQESKRNSDSQALAVQSGTAEEGEDHIQVNACAEPKEQQDQLQVSAPKELTEEGDHMQVSASEKPNKEQDQLQLRAPEGLTGQEEPNKEQVQLQVSAHEEPTGQEDHMQVSASGEPCEPGNMVSVSEEEQRRRADTPEELANLGKAVDMVQARSCQLSPSLLTVGQTPPDLDSPARHAFEQGGRA